MRILMTTDTVGGVWTFTSELVCGLLQVGCEISLISFGRSPNQQQQRWASEMDNQYSVRFRFIGSDAPLEWMQDNNLALKDTSQLLLEIASTFRPEVVHANQFCFGALALSSPKIVTAHSDVLSWADACRGAALPQSEWLHRYRMLVQDGLNGAAAVTAPTQSMLSGLSQHFAVDKNVTQVIPNGRSLARVPARDRRLQAVTAGRLWDEAKNIALLAEVVSPMPIMTAGECCFEGATQFAASSAVIHLGPLAEENLFSLFAESAVYLSTSKYEPFGLAPLEAALCGCAIVANDLPSLREVWGDAALYFTDAASLSKVLGRISEDHPYLEEMQARAYTRAQRYSREQMVVSYLELYQCLIEKRRDLADVA